MELNFDMRMIKMIIIVGAIYCSGIFCLSKSEKELIKKVSEVHKIFCELQDNNDVVENTVPCLMNDEFDEEVEKVLMYCIKKTSGIKGKDYYIRYYKESCQDVSVQKATVKCVVDKAVKNETLRKETVDYTKEFVVCVTKVTGPLDIKLS